MIFIFETHFPGNEGLALVVSGLAIVLSILGFVLGYHRISILLLILGGLGFRLLLATIDPFLHMWDEQFHALVALNMIHAPFHPKLYTDPVLPFDPAVWTANCTWLHKQPLFLWQMALSLKIFGKSFLALRLPIVILSTLCIPVVYRIVKILSTESCAYLAALLLSVNNLHIEIVSGRLNTDHNDVSFYCYIAFSIWAWLEYRTSGKSYWLIVVGLFSGMAVLVKWLPGLLVFAGWGIELLSDKKNRKCLKEWKAMGKSFLISILVFIPWQIYTYLRWPVEQAIEYHHNAMNFFSDLGHPGPWWFHFGLLREQYGLLFIAFVVAGIPILLRSGKYHWLKSALVFNLVLVYLFFSLAQTRMPLFCLIVSPILMLAAAFAMDKLIGLVKIKLKRIGNLFVFLFLSAVSFLVLDSGKLESLHSTRDNYREQEMQLPDIAARVKVILKGRKCIVFNCGLYRAVSFMYYTGLTAYDNIPSEADCRKLESEGKNMAVFDDAMLPAYIFEDSKITILPFARE